MDEGFIGETCQLIGYNPGDASFSEPEQLLR
jgi:hypothetical protein